MSLHSTCFNTNVSKVVSSLALLLALPAVARAQSPDPIPVEPGAAPSEGTENPDSSTSPGAEPNTGAPSPERASRPGAPSTFAPLDFCAHAPNAASKDYERQRVVVLNAHVSANADAPESEVNEKGEVVGQHNVFAQVRAGELVRRGVVAGLALPRFYMAFSRQPAPAGLLGAQQVSVAEARAAAGEDDFVAYSLGCSDWLMVPSIERGPATWSKIEKEKTVVVNNKATTVKYLAYSVSAAWNVKVRLFKRAGTRFTYAMTLDGSAGGLKGMAASMASRGPEAVPLRSYASTWPTAECAVGEPVEGRPGEVARCRGVEPDFTFELPPVPADAACGADDSVGGGARAMAAAARCALDASASRAVNLLNLAEKRAFAIHSPLGARGRDLVITKGAPDGVHRGDYYVARDATESELGFARVMHVGGGGEASPSVVEFKSGDAPLGTQMYEYALMGVSFGLRPGVMLLFQHGDLKSDLAFGGDLAVGYDATRLLPWFDEMWLRTNLGYFYASPKEALFNLDLGLEGVTYFGGGLAGVLGAGFSGLFPSIKRLDPATTKDVEYSGASTGAFARLGLEYAFRPDWGMNLTAEGRTGFSKAVLESDQSVIKYDGGKLLAAAGFLSLGHTF
jgi:hypothetical protein